MVYRPSHCWVKKQAALVSPSCSPGLTLLMQAAEAQQRLYFLRILRDIHQKLPVSIYNSTMESIASFCLYSCCPGNACWSHCRQEEGSVADKQYLPTPVRATNASLGATWYSAFVFFNCFFFCFQCFLYSAQKFFFGTINLVVLSQSQESLSMRFMGHNLGLLSNHVSKQEEYRMDIWTVQKDLLEIGVNPQSRI